MNVLVELQTKTIGQFAYDQAAVAELRRRGLVIPAAADGHCTAGLNAFNKLGRRISTPR